MNYGFFKIASASLKLKIAEPTYNKNEIIKAIDFANEKGAKLLVTPELSITGYTCGDLFFSNSLQISAEKALIDIVEHTKGKDIVVAVGMPVPYQGELYNCAVIIINGKIAGVIPKIYPANHGEFYEKRWFQSGKDIKTNIDFYGQTVPFGNYIFDLGYGVVLGAEICEDLWVVNPPSNDMALSGANVIVNLSASDEYASKADYRKSLVENQSARLICAYAYSSSSIYESTTDVVFGGATLITENGATIAEGERFLRETNIVFADVDIEKLNTERRKNTNFVCKKEGIEIVPCKLNYISSDLEDRYIDPHPFIPNNDGKRLQRCKEIFTIQATGLARRMEHIGSTGAVIGISGGLDSTLALLVAVEAMKMLGKDNSNILGITMPGFGTTDRTYNNALELMRSLGVTIKEISIKDACIQHMKDIEHDANVHDITYENTQARERTQILFDMANKHGKLLVGTGDLSELAMGWCTFNGDHMCMYGVNASVPKTLVRYLVDYVASVSDKKTTDILYDILDTPVSPELLPPDENGKIAQKTEDNIGPYELHDFFLYNFVRYGFTKEKLQFIAEKAFKGVYSNEEIDKWLTLFIKRFFISQFKRNCIPEAPKTGSVSLSPRGDWRMPSDASFADFI